MLSFRKIRNRYTAALKESKIRSWKKFVEKEGNKTPWSIIQTTGRRLKLEQFQSNISSRHTITWKETTEELLNALIPEDTVTNEMAHSSTE